MNASKEKAYAKINLYLDCIGIRPDGFHEIKTVMHSVSLCDTVTVVVLSRDKRNIRLQLVGNRHLPTDSKNLAYSAAALFMERAAIDADILIKLDKHIPVSAGLAGGSTDAAATLRALNRLFGKRFSDKALLAMAAELGSDVPYCLVGGTALCEGRGERITRLSSALSLHIVVAIDNEHVSTPLAYKALDERYSSFDGTKPTGGEEYLAPTLDFIKGDTLPERGLFNVFEESIFAVCPGAKRLKARLIELGATASMMSGSGPSVYGIFDTAEAAMAARDALVAGGARAYYATSV